MLSTLNVVNSLKFVKNTRIDAPRLLFATENGFGKRVPLSRICQFPWNMVGLIGYKAEPCPFRSPRVDGDEDEEGFDDLDNESDLQTIRGEIIMVVLMGASLLVVALLMLTPLRRKADNNLPNNRLDVVVCFWFAYVSHLFASSAPYRLRVMLCLGFVSLMASLLVKRVASNLKRVRKIASSSRFFSTKGYEFVQHDSMDECILKCDDSLGSSVAHRVVNDAFSPYVSPTENLSRLLNFSDLRIGYVHGTHLFPRWSVVEDDKALYILRDMTAKGIEDVRESVKEFMTGNHEENFKGAITISEEECISEDVIEYLKQIDPGRNAFPIIDIMRGDEYAPTGDYYYHVMKDAKEVKQFVESLHGSQDKVDGYSTWIKIYGESHNPQALYIIVVSGDPQIRNPYGGYAVEIFLDNSLYNVCDMKFDTTGDNRKLFIPKKIVEGNKTNPMAAYIGSRLLHGL
ncbi:hypothetical protein Tco_0766690 [Tanacetum coccineum]